MKKVKPVEPSYEDEPIFWFATLERARERGDVQEVARAQRELTRLGVNVTYPSLKRREVPLC